MLLGLLLPDPCDKHCPEDFKENARRLLPEVQGQVSPKDEDLRRALLQFIGDFANWDLSTNRKYLEIGRGLVKAAHPEETPLVVDPFAGGGSIPLEALRLGCETFASDLNPVASLILKVMLEDIPRHGPELAEELRRVGAKIKEEAEKELAEFYPPDPDGSRPIAYLWARTVKCESPNCGAEIPLVRSFWLCKKPGRKRALRYKVAQASSLHNKENIHEKSRQDACATGNATNVTNDSATVEFEIFEPKSDNEVQNGTVTRAKAACPCCNTVLSPERVRAQLAAQRGGADVVFGSANSSGGFQPARNKPAENTPSDLCRQDACATGDWADVLRELPKRVGDWMERLQSEGIRGADLVFACIGPALEIYSKYSKVVDAEEREIPLGGDPEAQEPHKRGFLAYVWEAVGRVALEQVLGTAEAKARNGASGSLEEDARLTALFLWTLQSTNVAQASSLQNDDVSGLQENEEDSDSTEEDEDAGRMPALRTPRGFSLVFDVVRRFAQPLGIHLEEWEGRIIETNKGVVRLLSVSERAGQLFGDAGTQAFSEQIEDHPKGPVQLKLFPVEEERTLPEIKGLSRGRRKSNMKVSDDSLKTQHGATTLDRVHAAMLLQSDGRTNALRALLKAEQERSPDFLRLANALSALYPKESEEKRLIDAMLLAVPK